jgi:four helix bundle protein
MASIRSHRDLEAWKVSMQLAKECYRITASFSRSEQFGLSQQLQRAVVSVPSNIAVAIAEDLAGHTGRLLLALVHSLEPARVS